MVDAIRIIGEGAAIAIVAPVGHDEEVESEVPALSGFVVDHL
jgi:hypothetical protein